MIPHNRVALDPADITASSAALKSGWLVNGNEQRHFENDICEFLGLPTGHAVATSSGSAALFLAIKLLNSTSVAMPSYVCSSLFQAAGLANTQAEVVDIHSAFPQQVLTTYQAPLAVYPYLYGFSSDLQKTSDPDQTIEDIAQALGASYDGKMLGTIGQCGVLSFYATKLMTTGGQGGMLVSRDKALIDEARKYLNFDMQASSLKHFNLPITEMQCAIGRSQLAALPQKLKRRSDIWRYYQDSGIPLLDTADKKANSVRYRAIVKCDSPEKAIRHFEHHQIKVIAPITRPELIRDTQNAIHLTNSCISIPLYPDLTDEEVEKIALTYQELER